ncbi:EAL domain-containing response regulator [Porticoccus sp.]
MNDVKKIHVLILDDDQFTLVVHQKLLANLGMQNISVADKAQQVLAMMDSSQAQPDLILLDLNMPDMDGVEFIRNLGGREYSGALILISGEGERMLQTVENLAGKHRIRVLGHLEKPISPLALRSILETWSQSTASKKSSGYSAGYDAEALREAINGGQLVNYYQPKVAVATGKVVGAEVLARWRHPKDGLVFPDQFINLAEESDLIDELAFVVLGQALVDICKLRESQQRMRVAVNLSMDNLHSLSFPDVVASMVKKAGFAAEDLVLEITESRLMQNYRSTLDILARLRLKHFMLSIDDFGMGHSSMAQLRDVPFNQLKVDQSFVHKAYANPTSLAIYTASKTIARELGIECVAEGVEDRKDWEFVRKTDCEIAQGYFIGRPMPVEKFSEWHAEWEKRYASNFEDKLLEKSDTC